MAKKTSRRALIKAAAAGGVVAGFGIGMAPRAATGSGEAAQNGQHDHHAPPVTGPNANATVSFGAWPADAANILDRTPNRSPNNRNVHQLVPHEATIKAGGTVNFIIAGFHWIAVYDNGTQPEDIDVPVFDPVEQPRVAVHQRPRQSDLPRSGSLSAHYPHERSTKCPASGSRPDSHRPLFRARGPRPGGSRAVPQQRPVPGDLSNQPTLQEPCLGRVRDVWSRKRDSVRHAGHPPVSIVVDARGVHDTTYPSRRAGSSFGISRWITASAMRYADAAMRNTGT